MQSSVQTAATYAVAVRRIKALYSGWGWVSLFTRIRFFTAPYAQLVPLVPRDGLIVDLGCGYGIFSNLLGMCSPERTVVGVDFDAFKIARAPRGLPNVRFMRGDVTRSDIAEARCILLIHVLHHLNSYEEQEALLTTCFRKLRRGGKLIVTEIDVKPRLKFFLTRIADHFLYPGNRIYYRFPDRMLKALAGFPADVQVQKMDYGTPFSHITYICTKRG